MARSRAEDYDERRTAIVERAAELFADKGFDGASLSDLARACNVSKSLIYHYFPSKEDILFAVMEDHVHMLVEAARKVARENANAPAPERLRRLTHELMRLYAGAQARHKVLLNELARLKEQDRDQIVAEQRELIGYVAGLLAGIRPDLPPAMRQPAAMLYFGMINWTHTWYDPKGTVSPDAIADLAADLTIARMTN
jgi:AcrR family transcriptional regulator